MTSQPYRDPAPSPALMRALGYLNRFAVLPGLLRVAGIELPDADRARLQAAVNPHTAAFLTPGHPEYMTDWMIDKELSRRFAPRLASWATEDVVNATPLVQRFWLANGLIANSRGGGGKAYSLSHARSGSGVLLHPEGGVSWQAERIGPVHPGAIEMAVTLAQVLEAESDARPVFIVPMVWRLTFSADVSAQLLREMNHIERACCVMAWPSPYPAERLGELLGALLKQRAHRLGLGQPALGSSRPDSDYFSAQSAVLADIRARLTSEYGALGDDTLHVLRTLRRGIRRRANFDPEGAAYDRELMMEFQRLSRIDPALYGGPTLTQEQIAEILKATRAAVVTSGWRNRLHNVVPRAVAPRVAHVRVDAPIDIRRAITNGTPSLSLLRELRSKLQSAQDRLGVELEPSVGRFRMRNPMATSTSAGNGYAAPGDVWTWNNRAS